MKKIVFFIFIIMSSMTSVAQKSTETTSQNISSDSELAFRLFPTQNMYTFLKLDTRNGKIWQVQWDTDSKYRFVTTLSDTTLVYKKEDEKNGRFTLYPTTNIYNFILLDQIDGRTWQVQWNQKKESRGIMPIY